MIERIIFKLARGCQRLRKGEGRCGKYLYLCSLCLASNKGEEEKQMGKEKQAERAHAWPCQGVSA